MKVFTPTAPVPSESNVGEDEDLSHLLAKINHSGQRLLVEKATSPKSKTGYLVYLHFVDIGWQCIYFGPENSTDPLRHFEPEDMYVTRQTVVGFLTGLTVHG